MQAAMRGLRRESRIHNGQDARLVAALLRNQSGARYSPGESPVVSFWIRIPPRLRSIELQDLPIQVSSSPTKDLRPEAILAADFFVCLLLTIPQAGGPIRRGIRFG